MNSLIANTKVDNTNITTNMPNINTHISLDIFNKMDKNSKTKILDYINAYKSMKSHYGYGLLMKILMIIFIFLIINRIYDHCMIVKEVKSYEKTERTYSENRVFDIKYFFYMVKLKDEYSKHISEFTTINLYNVIYLLIALYIILFTNSSEYYLDQNTYSFISKYDSLLIFLMCIVIYLFIYDIYRTLRWRILNIVIHIHINILRNIYVKNIFMHFIINYHSIIFYILLSHLYYKYKYHNPAKNNYNNKDASIYKISMKDGNLYVNVYENSNEVLICGIDKEVLKDLL